MASRPRPAGRPAAGPGRTRPRTPARSTPVRATASASTAPEASPTSVPASATGSEPGTASARRGNRITTRAVALAVVLLILTISYASSLRIYVSQARDIATARQQIVTRQEKISELQTSLQRWNDSAYVQAQARERFGWVLPGETGYKVIGPDGRPLDGGAQIGSGTPQQPAGTAWWAKLYGSVQAADDPAPAQLTGKPSRSATLDENSHGASTPR